MHQLASYSSQGGTCRDRYTQQDKDPATGLDHHVHKSLQNIAPSWIGSTSTDKQLLMVLQEMSRVFIVHAWTEDT